MTSSSLDMPLASHAHTTPGTVAAMSTAQLCDLWARLDTEINRVLDPDGPDLPVWYDTGLMDTRDLINRELQRRDYTAWQAWTSGNPAPHFLPAA